MRDFSVIIPQKSKIQCAKAVFQGQIQVQPSVITSSHCRVQSSRDVAWSFP